MVQLEFMADSSLGLRMEPQWRFKIKVHIVVKYECRKYMSQKFHIYSEYDP